MSLARTTQRITDRLKAELRTGNPGFVCFLVALLFALGAGSARAAATASETEVKAAFIYNFVKFVDWPAEAFTADTAPFRVAVFGDDDVTGRLKVLLSDKKAHGRSFEVKRVLNPQDAKNSQIVFVTAPESKRTMLVLDAVKKLPILTIGESDEFLDLGGMINFVLEDTQLRFEINTEPAEKVKLVISSKLLRLAKKRGGK